jgi:hypothetical protein
MFTVRAKTHKGCEFIVCDVEEIQFAPGDTKVCGDPSSVVLHFADDKGSIEYTSKEFCDIFVMNEVGSTVARYDW